MHAPTSKGSPLSLAVQVKDTCNKTNFLHFVAAHLCQTAAAALQRPHFHVEAGKARVEHFKCFQKLRLDDSGSTCCFEGMARTWPLAIITSQDCIRDMCEASVLA